jgi:Magnetochrome domain
MNKRDTNNKKKCDMTTGGCAGETSKNIWLIGIAGIIIVTLFSIAMFKSGAKKLPTNTAMQPVAFNSMLDGPLVGGFQQAALPPGCVTCPTVTQCFPGQALPQQPVAFQQAALPPGCVTCPTVTQCFPGQMPSQSRPPMQPVAFTTNKTAPIIFRDAIMPHKFRGVCSSCHIIKADIPIFRDAVMPHPYRGVCSNCHKIKPDIPITANAKLAHEYRGVCSNCHIVSGAKAGA